MVDEAELNGLIGGLQAVHDLEAAKGRLLARGSAAVPALRRYLCEGAAEVIFEPRRAAVEVLAALQAKEALLDYLGRPRRIVDSVARLAEEAVENAAARALGRWRTPQVLEALLRCGARNGARSGVVEALAGFECPEAVPYFLEALEDDLCRRAAEQALRQLGRGAEWTLLGAVRSPQPSAEAERPSSLRRRRAALQLLAEVGPSPECWPWLRPLLAAADPALAEGVARVAADLGDPDDRAAAAERVLALLPGADWYLQGEIADTLRRLGPGAADALDRAIAARRQHPVDSVLRLLLSLRRPTEAA